MKFQLRGLQVNYLFSTIVKLTDFSTFQQQQQRNTELIQESINAENQSHKNALLSSIKWPINGRESEVAVERERSKSCI